MGVFGIQRCFLKGGLVIKVLDLQQTADYLETATIEQTIDTIHAIIHIGVSEVGYKFVLKNSIAGASVLTESL